MKNYLVSFVIGCLMLAIPNDSKAQEVRVSAGFGLPELMNAGLRLQLDQSELGLAAGFFPDADEDVLSFSADYYYHFGGNSQYTDLRPWFLKAGLSFSRSENEWERVNYTFLVPRVGREFNISERLAIGLEMGIFIILSEKETEKNMTSESVWNFDFDFTGSVLPSAGVNLIYRL